MSLPATLRLGAVHLTVADLGYAGGPAPLDFDSLLATVDGEEPPAHVAEGLRMGHLHLHVGDIAEGLAFYRDVRP